MSSQRRPCPRVQSPAEPRCSWSPLQPAYCPPFHSPAPPPSRVCPPLAPSISVTVGRGIFLGPSPNPSIPLQLGSSPRWGSITPGLKKRAPCFPGVTLLHHRLCPHTSLRTLQCILSSCLEASFPPRCSPPRRHLQALLWANSGCLHLSPCLWGAPWRGRSWVLTLQGVAACPWVSHTFRASFFKNNLLKGDKYTSLSAVGKNICPVAEHIKVTMVITCVGGSRFSCGKNLTLRPYGP